MRRPIGATNIFSVLILAGLAFALWYGIVVGPAYLDNLDMKQFVSEGFNQAKNRRTDEQITRHIVEAASRVGEHLADDGYGNITWQPGLGITAEDVVILRDEVNDTLTVRVEYVRQRVLKPLSRMKDIRFVVEESGELGK